MDQVFEDLLRRTARELVLKPLLAETRRSGVRTGECRIVRHRNGHEVRVWRAEDHEVVRQRENARMRRLRGRWAN